ncbi:hypothetical protein GE061_011692 [Apolygus lucorum]|uniref:Uncharacterized protein n=1 Tax=Apolygus lucorum TaxID=248454 RepID=A0A8S9XZE5_APOLU|nr:hypothetical protein GE061_011692 [Apolygus lucorum]
MMSTKNNVGRGAEDTTINTKDDDDAAVRNIDMGNVAFLQSILLPGRTVLINFTPGKSSRMLNKFIRDMIGNKSILDCREEDDEDDESSAVAKRLVNFNGVYGGSVTIMLPIDVFIPRSNDDSVMGHDFSVLLNTEWFHKLVFDIDCRQCKKGEGEKKTQLSSIELDAQLKWLRRKVMTHFQLRALVCHHTQGHSCGYHVIFPYVIVDNISHTLFIESIRDEFSELTEDDFVLDAPSSFVAEY